MKASVRHDLGSIVARLFEGEDVSGEELRVLKAYLRELVADVPPMKLSRCLEQCLTRQHLRYFIEELLHLGPEDF